MFQIQPSTTAGTGLSAEFTKYPKVPHCSMCEAGLSEEFPVGIAHRGEIRKYRATAVIVRLAPGANPRRAKTLATICAECAVEEGYIRTR